MELRQFFHDVLQVGANLERLRQETFALLYTIPGMTYEAVMGMTSSDVEWYLKRVIAQKKKEAPPGT